MTVWMDIHEKAGMEAIVKSECDNVRMLDDFSGDYAVGGHLIERKRWDEVAQRMMETDRNLYYQVDKLVAAADELGLKPMLLLEGRIGAPIEHSRIPEERVAEYLAGLAVMGVTVAPSTGRKCSARMIARWEDGSPPDVRRVRGTPQKDEHTARFVIEGFPGVGPKTADALLEDLGSVMAVISAPVERLMEVEGIGPATAETIDEVRRRGP